MDKLKLKVIVTAGGVSTRYGKNKLTEILAGKPVIVRSVEAFTSLGYNVVVTAAADYIDAYRALFEDNDVVKIVQGGSTRQESVYNGLKACGACEFVAIHDAARPLISKYDIENCLNIAFDCGSAVLGVKTTDTVKVLDENMNIIDTPDRKTLFNAQTPQIFRYSELFTAHEKFANTSGFTDDSSLVEACNIRPKAVCAKFPNIKITVSEDIKIAENIISSGL
ncbi:MAG: 2-C-methyl-D-erythritol 4-phosphate cytidylyltransferase [Candidatus Gastranaerophilaceae bacterium]